MLPIPKKLLEQGVRDMVRISDARMSGTAYGTCVLHVAPEAFVGGPLALVETGDEIALDVPGRRLDLLVDPDVLEARRAAWTPRPRPATRGYTQLFADHVTQANEGCDFDFLHGAGGVERAGDPLMWDVVIVGAGILGLATARELLVRRPDTRVLVLEREHELAAHQTSHNSGVVHAGIYYAPGSLKAQLCTEGRNKLYAYCDEHGVPYERCGKLIIATDASELGALDELERRGRENGVPLRRLSGPEIGEIEPHAVGVAALHSPETGIVDFAAVARSFASEIRAAGASIHTGVSVERLARSNGTTIVETSEGPIPARRAIACAGLWSDRLAVASGEPDEPRIIPFRGSYLKLRPHARHLVRSLIYPVPDPSLPFLGVHLTKTVGGDVWLGPTALLAPSRARIFLALVRCRGRPLHPDLARHLEDGAPLLADRSDRAGLRRPAARLRRGLRPLRPGPQAVRRRAGPGRHPRPGDRPRREIGGRLRLRRGRRRAARPQRPLARRDLLARDRANDRRPPSRTLRSPPGCSGSRRRTCRWRHRT